MKFADLVDSVEWSSVEDHLLSDFPEAEKVIDGIRSAFHTLRDLPAVDTDMRIVVQENDRGTFGEDPFTEVVGQDGTLNKELDDFEYSDASEDSEYANEEVDYGLSLTPWDEWLGMDVENESLETYSEPELVANCLWEMTFHGYTQKQIEEYREGLEHRSEKIEDMTDEERREHLIPLEDVKNEVEENLGN